MGRARSPRLGVLGSGACARPCQGDETALLCPWEVPWDVGAPLPHVVAAGRRAFLIYRVKESNPHGDGTSIRLIDPADEDTLDLALVEFLDCYALKYGGANDEVIHGHPLYGKGLQPYGAHLIANSRWLAEEQQINAVHDYYRTETWTCYRHYLLLFHDELFECIAKNHQVEILHASFEQAVQIATYRLFH